MDELLEQFLIEGRELVAQATGDLSALERDPSAPGRVDSAFRAIHTLKGSTAIFDLAPMGAALHAAEDLLGSVRVGHQAMGTAICRALLECIDQSDRWIDAVEELGALPADASKEAVRIVTSLAGLGSGIDGLAEPSKEEAAPWLLPLLDAERGVVDDAAAHGRPLVALRYIPRPDCYFNGDDPLAFVSAIPELMALRIEPREPWPPLDEFDPFSCNLVIEAISSAARPEVQQLFRFIADQVELADVVPPLAPGRHQSEAAGGEAPWREGARERTIRVDASRIDALLDLVGELVVAKNGLSYLAAQAESGTGARELAAAIRASQAAADRIVGDLHRTIMGVRMVALERTFRRLPRLVREIAARLGREVLLDVKGEETRVDKAISDALFEPLLHLIRNAIDHGIEAAPERIAAGKAAQGRVALTARNLGDQVLIEVSDDGAGIDPARIREEAARRGLAGHEMIEDMEDDAVLQLVFASGFSTAREISHVSGRGVGMDAVRAAIERIGGRVALASRPGQGTTVSLRLPATAALTTVLLVRAGGQSFAIPLDLILETARVPEERILPVGLGRAFVLRNRTIPILELADLLGLGPRQSGSDAHVLLVDGGQGVIGVAVESFSERMDIMLRPLTGLLTSVPGVSGTTLLGDGRVLLVLDVSEIIG